MSETISVSTIDELYDVLRNAQGGEIIELAGGEYGGLNLTVQSYFDLTFASNVTIRSADADNPASFRAMLLSGVENLTLDGIHFDYTFSEGDPIYKRPFQVNNSSNIAITNSLFEGDLVTDGMADPDGYGHAIGLSVRGTSDIVLEGNEIMNFHRGLMVYQVQDITVRGNEVHSVRSDGMNFANVQGAMIENNHIHDFVAAYGSQDHRDMIQFWTNGTSSPSTDITIRGNLLDIGEGSWTQSIFMRNEVVDSQGGGKDMYYRNVVIENNTIYNAHTNGISVGEVDGLVIRDNSLFHVNDANNPSDTGAEVWVPAIYVKRTAEDVTITGNIALKIIGKDGQPDWSVANNALVQNTNEFAPGYYNDVLVTSSMATRPDGSHAFQPLPGGLLDTGTVGSSVTRNAGDSPTALFTVNDSANSVAMRVFDAGVTDSTLTPGQASGAKYLWTFSDGSSVAGKIVEHGFGKGGFYDATLSVKLADGTILDTTAEIAQRGARLLSFDGEAGAFINHGYGEQKNMGTLGSLDGAAIQLIASGTAVDASRSALGDLRGSRDFQIDLTLRGDGAGGAGELFRLHNSFTATVSSGGDLMVQVYNADRGETVLRTTGAGLNDGGLHDVSIRLGDGILQVLVDGEIMDEKAFDGTLPLSNSSNLMFGNPWGRANFVGDITAFDLSIGAKDYAAVPEPSTAPEELTFFGSTAPANPPAPVVDPVPGNDGTGEPGPVPLVLEGMSLDIQGLLDTPGKLRGDAQIIDTANGPAIRLDGDKDYVNVGRLTAFEGSERIAFSIDFTNDDMTADASRLVWNHMKLGLTVAENTLLVQVATANGFEAFRAGNLDMAAGESHSAIVMVDTANDRLQIVLNDAVVLDVDDADFDMSAGRENGWMISTPWNRFFEGDVSGFTVTDQFDFVDHTPGDLIF